jgi:hypothetical protein
MFGDTTDISYVITLYSQARSKNVRHGSIET